MPKFMKDRAIELLDGGVESYLLGLYGLNLPSLRNRRKQDTRFAPIMGMFGAAVELLVKACLVQAKGVSAMYKNGDVNAEVYKFGTECLDEFRKAVRDDETSVGFIWKDDKAKSEDKELVINYLCKFRLLQDLRANGLHAGIGCSRDVAVSTANDIYDFIQVLAKGKKLKAYLKLIPAPEATIKDREAIIEDLQRRLNTKTTPQGKAEILRGMYMVLPYVPDIKPEWIDCFEKISVIPPTQNDVNYLIKTLQEAHSIYLLKSRGGREGLPVRVENDNPDALPIAIQNIKRTLNNIPDIFNNDVLTANTWLDKNRLSLPIDDFLVDLFALGVKRSKVLQENVQFTAQQAWPFIVSAYSTQGTPRPCWEIIRNCDEIDKLIKYLERVKKIGNGYYCRRVDSLIRSIMSYKNGNPLNLGKAQDKVFKDIKTFSNSIENRPRVNPLTPQFIRSNPLSEDVASIATDYVSGAIGAGDAVEKMLSFDGLSSNDKRAVVALMRQCVRIDQRNGLVAVLRSEAMKNVHSEARKQMFIVDFLNNGLVFV
jgi:hypothetical protein